MPKAIDMDKAFDSAFTRGEAAPVKDYGRDLGNGLLESIMEGVAQRAKTSLLGTESDGSAKGSDSLDSMLDKLMKYKALQGLIGNEKEHTDSGMATVLKAVIESQSNMTKVLAELQSKSDERMMTMMKDFHGSQREYLDRLEQRMDQSKGGDDLAAIGKELIFNQLRSDPEEAYARRRQQFFEEFKNLHGEGRVVDFQTWKAEQEFALERDKLKDAREERQERQASQNQILNGFFSAVRPGQAGDAAPAANAPAADPLHRFQCYQCQTTFALPHALPPGSQLTCPQCQTPIQVVGPPGAPPVPPPPAVDVGGMPFDAEEM